MPRSALLAGGFVLALGSAAVVATAVAGGSRQPPPASVVEVPVAETVVACPGLRSREGYTESTVSAATPPLAAEGEEGEAVEADGVGLVSTLTPEPRDAAVLIELTEPGDSGRYTGRNGERDSVTGRATGDLAPGFSVIQNERTVDGGGRGLAGTACLPTGSQFWFVGAASGVGQRAVLVLTNPERATAAVDVTVYGRRGEVDAPGARGVQVPPRERVELRLDELVPGERVLALHVQVQSGRLSAAVTETDVEGFQPRGTDWLPAATLPARAVVVPGIPRVADGRKASVRLDVVAPGEGAVVNLELVTRDGTFVPLGADVLEVPAGSVRSVDLTEALDGEAAAVLVRADQPVVAGARVLLADPDVYGDVLFLAGASPLLAAAVVPDNRTTADLSTRLVLTAPSDAARLEVVPFTGEGYAEALVVDVAAGTTRWLTVEGPDGARSFGLVVRPLAGSGPVYGVRMLDEEGPRGPLVTALLLRTARLTARVPEAVPDVAVGTVP